MDGRGFHQTESAISPQLKGRACSAINAAYGETITVKTGAEGVYSAAFHELGLGAAVKARDGNKRGAEVAIGAVIG